ncbi:hypothetical protein SEA_FORK_99 [Microbacterium phage Fork]|nr:hypothetical protein SEA_FORK_99 [Microbacterium phage Fork]
MSAGYVTKLPKWARQEIEGLESTVEYHKRRLRESIPQGEGASDTIVHMGYGEEHVGLPNGTPIRFRTEAGVVEVRVRGDRVEIHSVGGPLAILPQVTNEVHVKVVRR